MHSLNITLVTIAAAFTSLASLPAASSQAQAPSSKLAGPVQHKVAKGETMWSISQKHQTSVGEIMEYNNLGTHVVREGMTLKIPTRTAVTPGKTNDAALPRPSRESIHIVKPGENFWTIAERYKINPQALAQANPNVNPNRMHPDMELAIPSARLGAAAEKTKPSTGSSSTPTKPNQPAAAKGSEHILAEGETFYSIAQKRGVKLADLVAANPTLKPERLKTGTKIIIPGATPSGTVANNGNAKGETKPIPTTASNTTKPTLAKRHTVAPGESLAAIAKKYSVSTDALLKQNNLRDSDSIYIGDVLSIPGASSSGSGKTASTSNSASKPDAANSTATTKPSITTPPTLAPEKKPAVTAKPHAPIQVASDGSVRSYIVNKNETENDICEYFGITKQELFEYNRLSQGSQLRPGDEIMIPPTTKNVVAR